MRKLSKAKLKENIIKNLRRDLEERNIGGADIAVWQDGELLFRATEGYADIDKKIPLTEDSLFRLASMTKPVTAVAAMIGVERGYFGLSDDMAKHFPELSDMRVGREENGEVVPDRKPKKPLKLYQFLSNTSGYMGASPLFELTENKIPAEAYESKSKMAEWCLKNTSFTYEPGECIAYCPYQAYDLIALLIERYSGESYEKFIADNIFAPLGINDITYTPSPSQWERLVKLTDKTVGGIITVDIGKHTFESFPLTYASAGAGLVGTLNDYYLFASMLLNGGELDGARIISPESVSLMTKWWVPEELIAPDAGAAWGLGVMVRGPGYPLTEHGRSQTPMGGEAILPRGSFGWSGAYGTHFWVDPDNKVIGIYMKNSRWHDSHGSGKTGKDFERAVAASFED